MLIIFQRLRVILADPEGREILRARPVINEATVDLAALAVSMQKCVSSRG